MPTCTYTNAPTKVFTHFIHSDVCCHGNTRFHRFRQSYTHTHAHTHPVFTALLPTQLHVKGGAGHLSLELMTI